MIGNLPLKGHSHRYARSVRPRAPFAFKNSMIHEFCNSHYVSHFAAFFIDVGAESSTVMPLIIKTSSK